jgi:argininosuccinate synthase
MSRIILGYTGGLETSVAIPWLAEHHDAEIIAVLLDMGQRGELVEFRERALALGARRCHVIDVREEFVRDYVIRALQAGALDANRSPQPAALGRPLIVRKLIDVARMEGATAIAHGTGDGGTDAARFTAIVQAQSPSLAVLQPASTWTMSRAEQMDYARAHGIPTGDGEQRVEVDANVWGRSIRMDSGTDAGISEDAFTLTRLPEHCPDQPAYIEIEFASGVPVRANGIEMTLLEMIESFETIAGAHGVGRVPLSAVGTQTNGPREIVEAPAAVVLHTAHADLTRMVASADLLPVLDAVSHAYAGVVDAGTWFSHTRESLDALVAAVQPRLTGTVKLELLKGACRAIERHSSFAPGGPANSDAQSAGHASAQSIIEDR